MRIKPICNNPVKYDKLPAAKTPSGLQRACLLYKDCHVQTLIPLALCALLLAGCQSGGHDSYRSPKLTAAQEKDQALQRDVYEKLISRVLAREGDLANTQGRTGCSLAQAKGADDGM